MDGWRIGYLIAPREVIAQTLKLHQHIVSCPNTFVQVGAQAALTSSQDCVREMVAEFDRRRRRLMSRLDALGISYVRPRGPFTSFPRSRSSGSPPANSWISCSKKQESRWCRETPLAPEGKDTFAYPTVPLWRRSKRPWRGSARLWPSSRKGKLGGLAQRILMGWFRGKGRRMITAQSGPFPSPLRRPGSRWIQLAFAVFTLGLIFSGSLFGAEKKPNIIFILSDDHRWDAMGNMAIPSSKLRASIV